ncbi:hypothetical protein BJ944DRAFT_25380 [Cunninghamella echinulata]|nr:hypothetical protein BJ944DRAFT_25380 [Cunninghamella echinulata]
MKKSEKNKLTPVIDVEAHQKHLKRQLDSLEYDNHQSLNDVEGLISMALAVQEQNEEGLVPRKSRQKKSRTSIYSSKTNLNSLLEEAERIKLLENSLPDTPSYFTCVAAPSKYPSRNFCSVCGFCSTYKCLRCGMKYCTVKCLNTHKETRCLKWTA